VKEARLLWMHERDYLRRLHIDRNSQAYLAQKELTEKCRREYYELRDMYDEALTPWVIANLEHDLKYHRYMEEKWTYALEQYRHGTPIPKTTKNPFVPPVWGQPAPPPAGAGWTGWREGGVWTFENTRAENIQTWGEFMASAEGDPRSLRNNPFVLLADAGWWLEFDFTGNLRLRDTVMSKDGRRIPVNVDMKFKMHITYKISSRIEGFAFVARLLYLPRAFNFGYGLGSTISKVLKVLDVKSHVEAAVHKKLATLTRATSFGNLAPNAIALSRVDRVEIYGEVEVGGKTVGGRLHSYPHWSDKESVTEWGSLDIPLNPEPQ